METVTPTWMMGLLQIVRYGISGSVTPGVLNALHVFPPQRGWRLGELLESARISGSVPWAGCVVGSRQVV